MPVPSSKPTSATRPWHKHARTAAAIAADLNSDRVVSYLGDFRAQLGSSTRDAEFDGYLRATFPKRLHTSLSMA